jgi:hypothetical protein
MYTVRSSLQAIDQKFQTLTGGLVSHVEWRSQTETSRCCAELQPQAETWDFTCSRDKAGTWFGSRIGPHGDVEGRQVGPDRSPFAVRRPGKVWEVTSQSLWKRSEFTEVRNREYME